jgi:heme exporter protein B
MKALRALFVRELSLTFGHGGGPLLACGFYAGVAVMMPLAEGPDPARLAAVAVGAAFATLALASLISLERMFEGDYEDGALDLLALGPPGLAAVSAIKCLAQWISTGLPLAILAPLVAISLGAPPAVAPLIGAASLLAGLGFSFIGGVGAALTLGTRRGGVLIAVIVLPLFTPLIVFGAGAVEAFQAGMAAGPPLALLAAYTLCACALAPFAMAGACRNALS